jgi:hypothetical protein
MSTSKRNLLIVSISLVAIFAISAFAVFAQDNPTTPPYGGYGMHGQGMGMMGQQGMGMMGNGDSAQHPMFASIAGTLGLNPDELLAELQAGKTISTIASEQNVDIQTVYDAALAVHTAHLAEQVAAGTITQEQADANQVWMQENITNLPMFSGTGHMMGHGAGTQGRMGGHGMGRWGR